MEVTLLTLLQSIPSCLNGDLVSWCQLGKQPVYQVFTGEANGNCPFLTRWVKVQVGFRVPTPSPVGHGTTSCKLLVLPQEDVPVGRHDYTSLVAKGFDFVCVCACMWCSVCACIRVSVSVAYLHPGLPGPGPTRAWAYPGLGPS